MQDPGRSDHFPQGTECEPWFCKLSTGTELKCAFKLSSANHTLNYVLLESQNLPHLQFFTYLSLNAAK